MSDDDFELLLLLVHFYSTIGVVILLHSDYDANRISLRVLNQANNIIFRKNR